MSVAESRLKRDLADPKCLKVKVGHFCTKTPVVYHMGIVLELDGKKRMHQKIKKEIPWPKYTVNLNAPGGINMFLAGDAEVVVRDYEEYDIGEEKIWCIMSSKQFLDGNYLGRMKRYSALNPTYQALFNNCRDFTRDALERLRKDGYIKRSTPFVFPVVPLQVNAYVHPG